MTIQYIEPLRRAFYRMRSALFRPFQFDKWIYVGLASWIAGWGVRGGYGYNWSVPGSPNKRGAPEFGKILHEVFDPVWKFMTNPSLLPIVVMAIVAIAVLVVVLMWVFSRGEFVFLDSVLNDRKAIVAPWNEYAAQGNSLFVWRLVVAFIGFAAFAVILAAALSVACDGRIPHAVSDVSWMRFFLVAAGLWLPLLVVLGYVNHFLTHFVTPLMYRNRVTTNQGWAQFGAIFRERPEAFILYGLFSLGVNILIAIALIPVVCLTCCTLGCLLMLPFIGTVVWLPVSYSLRAFGPEFLAQFGEAYSAWPPLPPPRIDMQVSERAPGD